MTHVVVVGCGVVGAAIAYELSHVPDLTVTVVDRQAPAQSATGAALGVLMAAISTKTRGNNLQMRLTSIQRYNAWIPELETITGRRIPFNQQGILRFCFEGEDLDRWTTLAEIRQAQGWRLAVLDRAHLASDYPQLSLNRVIAAVYSPQDRQVDPTALTLALVEAAQQNGVTFKFHQPAIAAEVESTSAENAEQYCRAIQTSLGSLKTDWLVIAAGLGTTPLTAELQQPVDIRPVLGQAVRVRLKQTIPPSGNCKALAPLQPVITGNDVHLVPLGDGEYWIGATVEFSEAATVPVANSAALELVMQQAIDLCPAVANAEVIQSWSGLRPRPEGRPAPIIERLAGYQNVLLAAGHYRNGVLLAPATAQQVRQTVIQPDV